MILSLVTFFETYADMKQASTEYYASKKAGNFDRPLVRLMVEKRNAWISGFACVLWVLLHRFRNLLKKYHVLLESKQKIITVEKIVYVDKPKPIELKKND